jgi:hypothetical protein
LREAPAGLPDQRSPPVVAEAGDPFGHPGDRPACAPRAWHAVRVAAVVDRLSDLLDWLFSSTVVTDVALQLQANWMADYRNSSGIVIDDGAYGPTITIEDSSRVDPWIVRQANRAAASCTERLAEFSRRDRPASGG